MDADGGGTGGVDDSREAVEVGQTETWQEARQQSECYLRTFHFFEDPNSSTGAYAFSMIQIILIILSIVTLVLETEPAVKAAVDEDFWWWAEFVTTSVFTVELIMRFLCAPAGEPSTGGYPRLAFCSRLANQFDFLAILPMYVEAAGASGGNAAGFRVLRIVRLSRVFKVFRLGKYSEGFVLITEGLRRSSQALRLMVFLMVVGMIIFASLIWLVEKPTEINGVHVFATIPDACWFVLVTFTTAGFGDAYPMTATGKFFSICTMLTGIVLLAMPISIIGQRFTAVYKELEQKNVDKVAQMQELGGMLSTLSTIMRETTELAQELEEANRAVMASVLVLASEANVTVEAPEPGKLRCAPREDEENPS